MDSVKRAREAQAQLEAAEAATEAARANRDRQVVNLCRQLSIKQVAEMLGLSRQTVANILQRWPGRV